VHIRVIDHLDDRIADFPQIVRQQIARHAHGDAGGSVHQQIGKLAGQDRRLHEPFVVVGLEVDGVEIQIGHQFHRDGRHAGFGVTHGGGRIAVGAAEVSLRVDERIAQVPILARRTRVGIDDRFAVRVIVAAGVAGDLGAFEMLGARPAGSGRSSRRECGAATA
jgi:hypothetical protein